MQRPIATKQEHRLPFHHFYGPVQLPELPILQSFPVGKYSPRHTCTHASEPADPTPALMAYI